MLVYLMLLHIMIGLSYVLRAEREWKRRSSVSWVYHTIPRAGSHLDRKDRWTLLQSSLRETIVVLIGRTKECSSFFLILSIFVFSIDETTIIDRAFWSSRISIWRIGRGTNLTGAPHTRYQLWLTHTTTSPRRTVVPYSYDNGFGDEWCLSDEDRCEAMK